MPQLTSKLALVLPVLLAAALPDGATAQTPGVVAATGGGTAAERISPLGPEGEALAHRTGDWDVIETMWDHPGADPVATTGLIAERRMVGSFLEESLVPAGAPASTAPKRFDLLGFDRVEGRWDYLSLETRVPVGLMPAWSFDRGDPDRLVVTFLPFAVAGGGGEITGQMLRMEQVISRDGPDHDVKDQYFILADGHGTKFLAHRYDYRRRH